MSNELRAAAERIVNAQRFWTGTVPFGPGYLDIDENDVMQVARAYLAEFPEDDDTKLTIEQAEKEFGARGHIDATVSSHRGVVAVKIDEWILLATRGDLRTLLSILPPF